ncbi:MAG: hypothetical protein VB141_06355 [Burkholderia gladioli]
MGAGSPDRRIAGARGRCAGLAPRGSYRPAFLVRLSGVAECLGDAVALNYKEPSMLKPKVDSLVPHVPFNRRRFMQAALEAR